MEPVDKDNGQLVGQNKKKPRLRWTRELHDHFVKAVHQLGGAYEATPKGIQKEMDTKEITLDQIKSHLQKYRLSIDFHARATSTVMIFQENKEKTHRRPVGWQTIEYMQTSKGKSLAIEEESQFNKGIEENIATTEAKDDYAIQELATNETGMKTAFQHTFASKDSKLTRDYKPFDLNISAEVIEPAGRE